MTLADKPLVWLHGEVKTPPFSAAARIEAGVLLRRLQRGERIGLPASRPMLIIGRGCHELRITDAARHGVSSIGWTPMRWSLRRCSRRKLRRHRPQLLTCVLRLRQYD